MDLTPNTKKQFEQYQQFQHYKEAIETEKVKTVPRKRGRRGKEHLGKWENAELDTAIFVHMGKHLRNYTPRLMLQAVSKVSKTFSATGIINRKTLSRRDFQISANDWRYVGNESGIFEMTGHGRGAIEGITREMKEVDRKCRTEAEMLDQTVS
eukprot:gene23529-1458_t